MQFSDHIISFIKNLQFNIELHAGIEVMNPFSNPETMNICERFYKRYYSDENKRWMIMGINPGRFGGGVTGIPFTDPLRLEKECGIENSWPKKQELSSLFIYNMINAFGGPEIFYKKFYITAVCPLGFTKGNKNLNYYDDKQLEKRIAEFVIRSMKQQLSFGIQSNVAFCLGEGKNFGYVSRLNEEHKFFDKIIPLSHPRFIMQYKLKKKDEYIARYLEEFKKAAKSTRG